MEPSAGVADTGRQLALDERVNVFVLPCGFAVEEALIRLSLGEDFQQRGPNRGSVRFGNHPGALEPLRPRQASPDVVFEEAAIEPEGGAERKQLRVRISLEPSRPQVRHGQRPTGVVCAAAFRAAVSIGSPQILMKPSVALLIELIARVVGRERLIVEGVRATCGRRCGSRL